MLHIYRFLINITYIISPIIIAFRLFKKKEHPERFKEKLCYFFLNNLKAIIIGEII